MRTYQFTVKVKAPSMELAREAIEHLWDTTVDGSVVYAWTDAKITVTDPTRLV
jgi:hypothetical protein